VLFIGCMLASGFALVSTVVLFSWSIICAV
jgi:hypothetical protein